jgi:DNA invertase Pin-like site-specific DNA recombinase
MKVSADHLRRDAFLYVRQSSLRQVFENTESTKRQYALRDRAVAMGWPIERVHVIDNDLGLSGAQAEGRDGFQRLVTEVAMGHAGIVLGLEVSRLARNNADWHRLLELAAMSHTLILDEDGVYDPAHFNDRLLLGLKGAMSEAELHILKSRLQGGILNKARRGELEMGLPIGFTYDANARLVLDPDRQIGKGDLLWGALNHSRVIQILHNPRYAGAFVYGRTRGTYNVSLKHVQLAVKREQWQVLIRDAHAGYISWDEFERNQITLRQNAVAFSHGLRGGAPREGNALLQGRVLCGRCGARMRVHYELLSGQLQPYYRCNERLVRHAESKPCLWVKGVAIDQAISELLLETVAPAAIEVALAVQQEIAQRVEQAASLRNAQLQRARYEAELARRRYAKVDPDNRLVADALEAEWNERLRQLDALQRDHERQQQADQELLDEPARQRIVELARDFPRVWNDARTRAAERKRMLGLLIEDVTLVGGAQTTVNVRWRGGRTQALFVDRPLPIARIRRTLPEVVQLVDELLETLSDKGVATRLNELDHRNWLGEPFTIKKVTHVRIIYGLKSRSQRLRERGMLTAEEVARQLDISTTTVHEFGRMGLLKRHLYGNDHRCLYEPPGDVKLIKGVPSRAGSRPPRFIAAQPSE